MDCGQYYYHMLIQGSIIESNGRKCGNKIDQASQNSHNTMIHKDTKRVTPQP